MLTSTATLFYTLLVSATASALVPVTRVDTLAKHQLARELGPKLSPDAAVFFPQDAEWNEVTERWTKYQPPTFRAAVEVANEADISAVASLM